MKVVDRAEVMGIADYETVRDHFRTRVIQEKKARKVGSTQEDAVDEIGRAHV